jgi:hypothetical protein
MALSPRVLRLQPPRRMVGDAVEPGTEPIGLPDRARLPGQDQERGLEGVFGVVGVAEQALTDTEGERSVPHDQGCEGQLGFCASVRREALQQFAIGQSGDRPAVDDRAELSRHSHSHDPDDPFPVPVCSNLGSRFLLSPAPNGNPCNFLLRYAGARGARSHKLCSFKKLASSAESVVADRLGKPQSTTVSANTALGRPRVPRHEPECLVLA